MYNGETRTVSGKVRHILDRFPVAEGVTVTAAEIAAQIWWTFYRGVSFSGTDDGTIAGNISELVKLPSERDVRQAMKNIGQSDARKKPDPLPAPWYAQQD